MSRFEETVRVGVPVRVAYDQWTQFEDFPKFMEGVRQVVQVDDRTIRWTASVGGREKEWLARITDQTPDRRVAWKSVSGAENAGAVLFEAVGPSETEITLRIDADPEGPVESAGDFLGFLRRRVHGDLERFKDHVEHHGDLDKGWRGEIHGDKVRPDPADVPIDASTQPGAAPREQATGTPSPGSTAPTDVTSPVTGAGDEPAMIAADADAELDPVMISRTKGGPLPR